MIRQTTCFVAECDSCGDDFYQHVDDYEGVPHFNIRAEALARIIECDGDCDYGHLHRRGDRVLCVNEAHIEDCELNGHQWGEWYKPINGRQMRPCTHCHDAETRTVERGQANG